MRGTRTEGTGRRANRHGAWGKDRILSSNPLNYSKTHPLLLLTTALRKWVQQHPRQRARHAQRLRGGGGRYTNLGDMCFWLRNPVNGRKDLYWQSRDNALLIKGGANYSYVRVSGLRFT